MFEKSSLCASKLRTPKPLPFGAKMMTARQKYDLELDNNVRMLSMKYPQEPGVKIKELLEELENNPKMVQDVLMEQGARQAAESRIKEVKHQYKQQREPCKDPQKKMLMKAIVSLYKKLEEKDQAIHRKGLELAGEREENQKLRKENAFYKTRSSMLAREQLSNEFDRNMHIY